MLRNIIINGAATPPFKRRGMGSVTRRPHSPPFQRRGARGIKPLDAEGGVVSNMPREAAPYRRSRGAVFRHQTIAARAPFCCKLRGITSIDALKPLQPPWCESELRLR